MPDGTNKSIFSDLDREECKEKKRRTGSKRKCTCKCLPGWKKGKSLDADGNKVILCTVVSFKIISLKMKVLFYGQFLLNSNHLNFLTILNLGFLDVFYSNFVFWEFSLSQAIGYNRGRTVVNH